MNKTDKQLMKIIEEAMEIESLLPPKLSWGKMSFHTSNEEYMRVQGYNEGLSAIKNVLAKVFLIKFPFLEE